MKPPSLDRLRSLLFLVPAASFAVVLVLHGPLVQDPAYHDFADQRVVLGIPHVLDVVTNAGFLLVGVWGLLARPPLELVVFFGGLVLTSVGSAAYHLDPRDATLVLDRAPMTVAFAGLAAALVAERVGPRAGRRLLLPLVLFGLASVAVWAATGDLRLYAVAQYVPLWGVVVLLVTTRGPSAAWWITGAGYALAKAAEALDRPIWLATGFVSGHNLKHLLAAGGTAAIAWMVTQRRRAARRLLSEPGTT